MVTEKEFIQRIIEKHGKMKFEFKTVYCGVGNPLAVKCLDCGAEFEIAQARSLLGSYGCMSCRSLNFRRGKTDFKDEVARLHPDIELLSSYVNARTKVSFRCNKCGTEDSKLPMAFRHQKSICSVCYRPNGSITHEQFVEKVRKVHGDNYTVIGKYINNDSPILVRCNVCNTEREIGSSHLTKGYKCQECDRRSRTMTHEEFEEKVKNAYCGQEYTLLDRFVSSNTHMRFKHKCGMTFKTTPKLFLQGSRCPYCTWMSSGAKTVYDYLKLNNIPTLLEATHPKLVSGRTGSKLRMDFLCKVNDKFVNIEYNGNHHYIEMSYEENLEEIKYLDSVKLQFCLDNGIYHLRVPYRIPLEDIHNFLHHYLTSLEGRPLNLFEDNLINSLVYDKKPYGDWCLT